MHAFIKCYLLLFLSLSACTSENNNTTGYKIELLSKKSSEAHNGYQPAAKHGLGFSMEKNPVDSMHSSIRVAVKNEGDSTWHGILKLDLEIDAIPATARFFLPGFIYGTNRADQPLHKSIKSWPRLKPGGQDGYFSDFFLTRSDRLSHPMAMLFSQGVIYGISASPYLIGDSLNFKAWYPSGQKEARDAFYRFTGFGCAVQPDKVSLSYTLGYENSPWLYVCCQQREEQTLQKSQMITIEKDSVLQFDLTLYHYKANEEIEVSEAIRKVYTDFHESPREGATPQQALKDISSAIFLDGFSEKAVNYATAVSLKNAEAIQDNTYSIAWTGGMAVAYPMLMTAIRMNHNSMRSQASDVIENIVDHSINRNSGLPFDALKNGEWTTSGWWNQYIWSQEAKEGHSSYLIGEALYYILAAYDAELTYKNTPHPEWLQFVKQVSDQIEDTKMDNGEYPYRFSAANGQGAEYDSFGGAWCLATRSYLTKFFPEEISLNAIDQSLEHYWQAYVRNFECYGTPHDIWKATDQEGILAFIKAARIMHQLHEKPRYLQYLKDGIDYEFSWKYPYNVPVQIPPLNRGWSSSGASITSIANPHAHPMGSMIADEILYLALETNDPYYHNRHRDVVKWGLQSYNRKDGEFDFGRKGWMSERFCTSEGLLIEKYPNGSPASTWFIFHPWGAAAVLESLSGQFWEYNSFQSGN
jgi:hypothetical protein